MIKTTLHFFLVSSCCYLKIIHFFSDNLFPESENPSRVFVVIVESDAYLGTYQKSPFTFRRNWKVESQFFGATQNILQAENNYLKSSLDELKSQMSVLVSYVQNQQSVPNNQTQEEVDSENESLKSKRASRYKNKKKMQKDKNTNVDKPSTSSFLGRIYNSFQTDVQSEHGGMSDIQSISDIEPQASEVVSGLRGTITNYWITKIELELMSSPLDQFSSRGTEDEAMNDYVRLQRCVNQYNQVISCGLSYDHFLKGAFIAAFDLTTNQQPGLTYAINTVRTGKSIIFMTETFLHCLKVIKIKVLNLEKIVISILICQLKYDLINSFTILREKNKGEVTPAQYKQL